MDAHLACCSSSLFLRMPKNSNDTNDNIEGWAFPHGFHENDSYGNKFVCTDSTAQTDGCFLGIWNAHAAAAAATRCSLFGWIMDAGLAQGYPNKCHDVLLLRLQFLFPMNAISNAFVSSVYVVVVYTASTRWTIIAVAAPPPLQMLAHPNSPTFKRCSIVVRMREPLDPIA